MKRFTSLQGPWLVILALGVVFAAVALVRIGRGRQFAHAAPLTAQGFTTQASVEPGQAAAGTSVTITASVSSSAATTALVDIEVHGADGAKLFQQAFDNQSFSAGTSNPYSVTWAIPASVVPAQDTVKIGIFSPGWGTLEHWNDTAASISITAANPTQQNQTQLSPTVAPTVASASGFPAQPASPNFLVGANVPWYHWGQDFGGGSNGGVSDPAVQQAVAPVLAQASASGMNVIRWWMFEGTPSQITTDTSGTPTGINPTVYADIDAALQLAAQDNLYYDFVLFSSPTAIPNAWITDAAQRAALAAVLGQLFAHYQGNPHVWSWEIFNEPEWDIWNKKIDEAPVQATVRAIAFAVHANSHAFVTVGSATLEGLPMWVGQGLDYYQAHWYDPMSSGGACAICTTYASVQTRYNLDAPLVIGEFDDEPDVQNPDSLGRLNYWYTNGYAGAWAWSLFPGQTSDHLAIDFEAVTTFTGQHPTFVPPSGHP